MGRAGRAAVRRAPLEERAIAIECERVLAIGKTSRPVEDLGSMGRSAQVSLLEYHELLVQREAPEADIVLSPMVGDTFDCLDVAVHLHASGFRGRLHVMAPALPDPAILRREVASICPGIEVDVVIRGATGLMSQTGPRRS